MLLPEKKEREYRFGLALRMGLPIFGLILVLIFTTLVHNYNSLDFTFYIESAVLLLISVYFIFFLIYKGFDANITDSVSKTFTREYLYKYLKEKIQKSQRYTLLLVSVDNISDINTLYGIKNGDKILYKTAKMIGEYIKDNGIDDFPLGRLKGGDFVISLEGSMIEHKVMLELLCLKSEELKFDNIEVKISGAITDTSMTKNLDYLIDNLFENQEANRYKKHDELEMMDPSEVELLVVDAIENSSLSIASQKVYDINKNEVLEELFVRIKAKNGKYIHQKKYMKVINKLGLTLEFEKMLVKKVFSNLDKLNAKQVVLSISASSLRDLSFFKLLKHLLEDKSKQNRVCFIFCENELYSKVEKFNNYLKSYRELGLSIAIDRVGDLHSSFVYLRELDIDMIRFDSSCTKKEKIFKSKICIEGLSYIAKAKGAKVWVKMIEEEKQFEVAKEMQIDYIQGKLFSQLREEVI